MRGDLVLEAWSGYRGELVIRSSRSWRGVRRETPAPIESMSRAASVASRCDRISWAVMTRTGSATGASTKSGSDDASGDLTSCSPSEPSGKGASAEGREEWST